MPETTVKNNKPDNRFLDIGGKVRPFKVNLNVLSDFEDTQKKSVLQEFKDGTSAKGLRLLVWLALREADTDPTLTIENVGRWMNFADASKVIQEVVPGFWSSDGVQLAPYVPTQENVARLAFQMAELKEGETVLDLGCGVGSALKIALTEFKAGHVIGYELDDDRHKECLRTLNHLGVPGIVEIVKADANLPSDEHMAKVDVLFLYLLTGSNETLRPILENKLRKGTRVVSHDFPFNVWKLKAHKSADERSSVFSYVIGE